MDETHLDVEDPNDRWSYLSEESPSFQAEVEEAYETYYEDAIKHVREIRMPFLQKMMFRSIPKKYTDPYKRVATLNKLSKDSDTSKNPFHRLSDDLINKISRAGTRKRRRSKTKRKNVLGF